MQESDEYDALKKLFDKKLGAARELANTSTPEDSKKLLKLFKNQISKLFSDNL